MGVFWRLLSAHFLADFPFQTRWLIENKTRYTALVIHGWIYLVVAVALTQDYILWDPKIAIAILITTILHIAIDYGKNILTKKRGDSLFLFLSDQILHLATIYLTAYFLLSPRYDLTPYGVFFQALTFAVFAIWGTPILFRKAGLIHTSQNEPSTGIFFTEKWQRIALFERAVIFVAIYLGGIYYVGVAVAFIVRLLLKVNQRDVRFPLPDWLFVGALAAAARFGRF